MLQPPGAQRSKVTQSMRKKIQESPDEIVRKLQRLPPNKKCCDCSAKLPNSVNIAVGSFVCTACAGVHRELNQRVKGVGHSSFTSEEADFLSSTDNDKINAIYLARMDSKRMSQPSEGDLHKVRQWIIRKYRDRAFYSEPNTSGITQQNPTAAPQPTVVQIPPKDKMDLFGGFTDINPSFAPIQAGNNQQQHPPMFQANFADFGKQPNGGVNNTFPADFGSHQTRHSFGQTEKPQNASSLQSDVSQNPHASLQQQQQQLQLQSFPTNFGGEFHSPQIFQQQPLPAASDGSFGGPKATQQSITERARPDSFPTSFGSPSQTHVIVPTQQQYSNPNTFVSPLQGQLPSQQPPQSQLNLFASLGNTSQGQMVTQQQRPPSQPNEFPNSFDNQQQVQLSAQQQMTSHPTAFATSFVSQSPQQVANHHDKAQPNAFPTTGSYGRPIEAQPPVPHPTQTQQIAFPATFGAPQAQTMSLQHSQGQPNLFPPLFDTAFHGQLPSSQSEMFPTSFVSQSPMQHAQAQASGVPTSLGSPMRMQEVNPSVSSMTNGVPSQYIQQKNLSTSFNGVALSQQHLQSQPVSIMHPSVQIPSQIDCQPTVASSFGATPQPQFSTSLQSPGGNLQAAFGSSVYQSHGTNIASENEGQTAYNYPQLNVPTPGLQTKIQRQDVEFRDGNHGVISTTNNTESMTQRQPSQSMSQAKDVFQKSHQSPPDNFSSVMQPSQDLRNRQLQPHQHEAKPADAFANFSQFPSNSPTPAQQVQQNLQQSHEVKPSQEINSSNESGRSDPEVSNQGALETHTSWKQPSRSLDDAFSHLSMQQPNTVVSASHDSRNNITAMISKPNSAGNSCKYVAGQSVYYTSSNYSGPAEIVKVHLDDALQPFYTVLVQGKEKQTDDSHLSEESQMATEVKKLLNTLNDEQLTIVKHFIVQQVSISSSLPDLASKNILNQNHVHPATYREDVSSLPTALERQNDAELELRTSIQTQGGSNNAAVATLQNGQEGKPSYPNDGSFSGIPSPAGISKEGVSSASRTEMGFPSVYSVSNGGQKI